MDTSPLVDTWRVWRGSSAAALAVLAPVLAHGSSFGSYDVLSQFGVLRQPGVVVHNLQAGDQSDQIIPWATLAWTQVHHGQLPLWNPYEALGMPLAFNWQTAAFSVPSLIGYLFPLHLAFTVQVIVTLVIAGTGMYALCRVLRLGHAGLRLRRHRVRVERSDARLAGLAARRSALVVRLAVRGRPSSSCEVSTAFVTSPFSRLVIAAMVYAGQAEVLTLGGLALLVFVVVLLVQRSPVLGGSGPIRPPGPGFVRRRPRRHRPRRSAPAARFSGHFGIPAGRARRRPGGDPEGESRPSLAQPGSCHLPRVRRTAYLRQPLVWLHRRIL